MSKIYPLVLLLLSYVWPLHAYIEKDYWDNELYIMLHEKAAHNIIDQHGHVIMENFERHFTPIYTGINIQYASVPFFKTKNNALQRVLHITFEAPADLDLLQDQFDRHPDVVYAEKVPREYLTELYKPNDLGIDAVGGQWYLHKIQAPEAWLNAKGDRNIKISVVDDAVDITHPDLADNLWINPGEIPDNGIDDDGNGYIDDVYGYDVADDDGDPAAPNRQRQHGTHVAGLACATTDNSLGIASIGFDLSLISVKCTRNASSALINTYEGIAYAVAAGADIINCSWSGRRISATHEQVIQHALNAGCLIVAAAGNDGIDRRMFPAAYPGVISVGSTSISDQVSGFSNYGEWLSVFAPGSNIRSTLPPNRYGLLNGTSMASPIVAGLLGLMKSVYPDISSEDLKTALLTTADSIEHLNDMRYAGKTGAGRVNAYRAIQYMDSLRKKISDIPGQENKLVIYPNPAQNEVIIESNLSVIPDEMTLLLKDIAGRTVLSRQYDNILYVEEKGMIRLNISSLIPGLYFVVLETGKGNIYGKIMVE